MAQDKFRRRKGLTAEGCFSEAIRYYQNALAFVKKAKVERHFYRDVKPIQEACGTGYLAILYAVDGFLLLSGVPHDRLPKSVNEYYQALAKYTARDGQVQDLFYECYQSLHIVGYYYGYGDARIFRIAFDNARGLIEKLSGAKVK